VYLGKHRLSQSKVRLRAAPDRTHPHLSYVSVCFHGRFVRSLVEREDVGLTITPWVFDPLYDRSGKGPRDCVSSRLRVFATSSVDTGKVG